MDELPPEPENLRFLRLLVTALMATMIVGIVVIVGILFIRFGQQTPAKTLPGLPEVIVLPAGQSALAVTDGGAWYAVVTDSDVILVFDKVTGALKQRVDIVFE